MRSLHGRARGAARRGDGAPSSDLRPYIAANALIGVHRALIAYVRERISVETPERGRFAREVRARGEAARALLAEGLDGYATKA
jgi:hypothetical protein